MPMLSHGTPTKVDKTFKNRIDPPGTPPMDSTVEERSDNSIRAVGSFHGNVTPKKIPPAFSRTLPSPVAPRVLFPSTKSSENNREKEHKSPPSVKRKGKEKAVFLWELEDKDDIPALSDSSGEFESSLALSDRAVLSGNVTVTKKVANRAPIPRRGEDVNSDPGYNYSRAKTYSKTASYKAESSSDAAGPTSSSSLTNGRIVSPPKRAKHTTIAPSGNIPQSPEEHSARLKDIMSKREKKKKRKKTKKRCNTDDSDISGASSNSNTRRSSNVSNYKEDPIHYLNEKLQNSEINKNAVKSDDTSSAVSSRGSKESTVSSLGSGVSNKWKDAKIEKKYPKVIDADKGSDVSSEVSGASNTSSIFAATRAKLKGYLTTYKKTDKKKLEREKNNKSTKGTASPQSPARVSSPNTERIQGTPNTLFSIEESDSDSPRRKNPPKPPLAPTSTSRHRKSFEEKILQPSTPPSYSSNTKDHVPRRQDAVENDTATKVIDLPWSYDKGTAAHVNSATDLKYCGFYSGPVNELLQPHGRGKVVLKANNLEVLYGIWEDGKLVSPLTDEMETTTDDANEIDEIVPNSPIGHVSEKKVQPPGSTLRNHIVSPTSIKYVINSHYNRNGMKRNNKIRDEREKRRRLVKYNIGDACRTPQDMIICREKHEATESVGLLKKWDGAFIKRSSGLWTYAVLIERSMQPLHVMKRRLEYMYWATVWEVDPRTEKEDSMLFAIDGEGSTKIIPKHCWAKYIRRVQRNYIPDITKKLSNPLPTEVMIEPNSQDDGTTQNEGSEYFKVLKQCNGNGRGGEGGVSERRSRESMRSSFNDGGFDNDFASNKEADGDTPIVYPC